MPKHPENRKPPTAVAKLLAERGAFYGSPSENYSNLAAMWNAFLRRKLKEPILPREVALMFILTKCSREQHRHKADNLDDIAGYAEVVRQIEEPGE